MSRLADLHAERARAEQRLSLLDGAGSATAERAAVAAHLDAVTAEAAALRERFVLLAERAAHPSADAFTRADFVRAYHDVFVAEGQDPIDTYAADDDAADRLWVLLGGDIAMVAA